MTPDVATVNTLSALDLARLIAEEHGQPIRANCCGVWVEHTAGAACPLEIDVGTGYVPAVRVHGKFRTVIFIGPFSLEQRPSHLTKLAFYCDNYFVVREMN